jgi:hypothetical protein
VYNLMYARMYHVHKNMYSLAELLMRMRKSVAGARAVPAAPEFIKERTLRKTRFCEKTEIGGKQPHAQTMKKRWECAPQRHRQQTPFSK